jgi:hypothetical protein
MGVATNKNGGMIHDLSTMDYEGQKLGAVFSLTTRR